MLDLSSLNNAIKSLDNAVLVWQDEEEKKCIPANVREVIEAGVIQILNLLMSSAGNLWCGGSH